MTEDEKGRPDRGGPQLSTYDQFTGTLEYLHSVYGNELQGSIVICTFAPDTTVRHFSSIEEAAAYADGLDALSTYKGIYCTGATVKPVTSGRGRAEDAHTLHYFSIDMDVWHPVAHKASNLPRSLADCRDWITALGFPDPTRWIDSGFGYYPQWQYAEPVTVDDWRKLQAQYNELKAYISKVALDRFGWKTDPTFDLARVWKLPGTTNRKVEGEHRPCYVLEEGGPLTSLDELLGIARGQGEEVGGGQLFEPPAPYAPARFTRSYTEAEAAAYCEEHALIKLREAPVGNQNNQINSSALVVAHFRDFWPEEARVKVLLDAVPPEYADEVSARRTIQSAFQAFERFVAAGDEDNGWVAQKVQEPESLNRIVDLTPYLDGTYTPPLPSVGSPRSDGKHLLYPGRWHTVVGPTGTGKSFFALLHCIEEMRKGNKVIYAHFEESSPGGTLQRLRAMAPDLSVPDILERFVWVDCNRKWTPEEWSAVVQGVHPSLAVLDGMNRAATQHGLDPSHIEAPGKYAEQFVKPCAALDACVLSLGHPPKARGRETERHGFGATGWLDDVEGVGFRLVPSKKRIKEGESGYAMLYSVKDRYGQVERGEELADGKDMDGWFVLGAFWVDSTHTGLSRCGIKLPEADEAGGRKDKIDVLADSIASILGSRGSFKSIRNMQEMLLAHGVKHTGADVAPALERLSMRGLIDWPEVEAKKSRPGVWRVALTASDPDLASDPD